MTISYTILRRGEAYIDIDGIIKDLEYRHITSEEEIYSDILENSYYYIDNYSDIPEGAEIDDECIYDLVKEVVKQFKKD